MVTRGPRCGRRGYIYGSIERCHPLVTKTLVIMGAAMVAIALEDLARASQPPQLDLFPKNEKSRRQPVRAGGGEVSDNRALGPG